jgi:hypothetical protein
MKHLSYFQKALGPNPRTCILTEAFNGFSLITSETLYDSMNACSLILSELLFSIILPSVIVPITFAAKRPYLLAQFPLLRGYAL